MADKSQAQQASETEISVDLNAADENKAVTRRASSDIASGVRDNADIDQPTRTKAEKELFKRMGRLERNLEKQFDQKMANREAEWQRERSEMQGKLDKLSLDRGGGDDRADAAHEAAMTALKDKLAAAYEKGDSAASADITLQISKLDAQFWAKKAAAAGVTSRETATDTAQRQPQTEQTAPRKGPTPAGARFMRANEDWWDDPDFAVEKGAADAIYLRLVQQEGFDPKDEETFKEVAKQLKEKFPKLAVRAGRRGSENEEEDEGDDVQRDSSPQARRSSPAARIDDRGAAGAVNRGQRRTLSKEEIATMKACRLDPDNDKDVVTFLREAVALEQAS